MCTEVLAIFRTATADFSAGETAQLGVSSEHSVATVLHPRAEPVETMSFIIWTAHLRLPNGTTVQVGERSFPLTLVADQVLEFRFGVEAATDSRIVGTFVVDVVQICPAKEYRVSFVRDPE